MPKKGFTLVELVIVIAILAILALILVPSVGKYSENAEKSKNEASAKVVYTSAIFEHAANPKQTSEKLKEATAEASNVQIDSITINVDKNTKQVNFVTFTSDKGIVIKYDGTDFVDTTPGS